ncbi:MAG TPA: [acyl-carrier-protein] S-malonyltransferase [Phycisphaerales bacterium]|nr:[acyl-carrier-protein] S-malonyltransferase [Phycisphaerales bacterium]
MKTAFIFPGQGAQGVGMGKDLYEAFAAARVIFDQAEDIARLPLKKLCFEGPEDELARTDVAQPAIFTVSAAALACLGNLLAPEKVAALRPDFMAGLSLGEYTALYAADRIDFADALRLVTLRGAAMQKAAVAVPSGMVAVMGLDEAKANELCQAAAQGEPLVAANFNAPGQVVVSGAADACKRAEAMAKDFGASGAVALKVAGAFHSPLMSPAAEELRAALDAVTFRAPRGAAPRADRSAPADPSDGQDFASAGVQVIANVDAQAYACPACIKGKLLAQLTGAVRWQQSMEGLLAAGVEKFYEIGPGRVLAGLMRRIDRKAAVVSVNSRETLEKLAEI